MKNKLIVAMLVTALSLTFTACGSEPTEQTNTENETNSPDDTEKPDKEETPPEDSTSEEAPQEDATQEESPEESSSGQVEQINFETENGKLVYVSHEMMEDYEGNPAVVITFEYTNYSDEASTAMWTYDVKGFQNGLQMDTATISSSLEHEATENRMREVKKDTPIHVAFALITTDMSQVELEVSELIDFSGNKQAQLINLE